MLYSKVTGQWPQLWWTTYWSRNNAGSVAWVTWCIQAQYGNDDNGHNCVEKVQRASAYNDWEKFFYKTEGKSVN